MPTYDKAISESQRLKSWRCNCSSVRLSGLHLIHFYTGNPYRGTLFNSEDSNELSKKPALHEGQHCLLRFIQSSGTEVHTYLLILTCAP